MEFIADEYGDRAAAGAEQEAARLRGLNERRPHGDPDRDDCACCQEGCEYCNGGAR
jgi:hypothetical protein